MNKDRRILWIAWILVSFFYAYQYILRVMPSILMEDIVKKFSLTPHAFGQFSGVYYLGYALMHLPIGIFLDRFGPKNVLPLLIACTSIGLLPILYAESFVYPILGRVLIGIGSSGAILGIFKVLHLYFEPQKFSRFLSFSVMIGLFGAIYGGAPIHFAREQFGFENVVFSLILVSAVLAILTYILMPRNPAPLEKRSVAQNLKNVFSNKPLWILCLVSGFMVGPLEGFADVWGVQFLKIFHELTESVAAGLPSWIFIGMCVGSPILNFIVEKTAKPLHVVLSCGITMALAFILLLTVKMSAPVLSILFFIVGVCSAYQVLMFYQVSTYLAQADKTMSSVAANMIIMIFGYAFHSTIGKSISWIAHQKGVDGFHDPAILVTGIAIIPLALICACLALAWFMLRSSSRSHSLVQ